MASRIGRIQNRYRPQATIIGKALANLIIECAGKSVEQVTLRAHHVTSQVFELYEDGSSNAEGWRVGLILVKPKRQLYTYALILNFPICNNENESKALISRMSLSKEIAGQKNESIDSQLVVSQIEVKSETKGSFMKKVK
ncbi:hypothetical protein ACH5RR_021532 [Cinchona calisaya]|uniref:Uncharacterized protein n=1 Tax=Cinchona calisaya TaxID=153742 RepID=A0ABD2ZMJ0_9GENT